MHIHKKTGKAFCSLIRCQMLRRQRLSTGKRNLLIRNLMHLTDFHKTGAKASAIHDQKPVFLCK